MSIEEIDKELQSLIKDKTLEEKRNLAVDYKKDIKENDDIYITYINYIKNIIKDNTNKDLLFDYLYFLQNNETQLSKKYGENFVSFDDEIKQFQYCFPKSILIEKFKYTNKMNNEHEKLLEFLNEVSRLNLDIMGKKEINIYLYKFKKSRS